MKVSIYQRDEITNNVTTKITLTAYASGNSTNNVIGELFEIVKDYKECKQQLFKFSKPLIIEAEGKFNTELADKKLQQALKLTWNPKGKGKFAKTLRVLIRNAERTPQKWSNKKLNEVIEAATK